MHISLIFLLTTVVGTGLAVEQVPFALLRRILPSNCIVLEAGAYHGEDTNWMSEFWKNGHIHSFEPNPMSYAQLTAVANKHPNVSTYQMALSDRIGEAKFYIADGASSLLKPTANISYKVDFEHPVSVKIITIDQWAIDNNMPKIDFMWLDLEGNELNALKGAKQVLKFVCAIYTEVNFAEHWSGCVQYDALKNFLTEQGFEEIWSEISPGWNGNVLFCRKDQTSARK